MAELSDIMMYVAQLKREEREEERDKALIDLNKLNIELNAKSGILEKHLARALDKTYQLEDSFDAKNIEYEAITGELADLEDYNPSSTLEILDELKTPILNMHITSINDSRKKSSQIKNALNDINETLKDAKIIEQFYKGEGVDYTGGKDPKAFDVGDFTIKKLKLALGLKAGENIDKDLKNYIKSQRSDLQTNLVGINQVLDSAVLDGLRRKKEELSLEGTDKPSYNTQKYISELALSLSTIADPRVISTIESQPMSDIYMTATSLAYAQESAQEEQVVAYMEDLVKQKIELGESITGLAGEDDFNQEIGSKILTGFKSYYDTVKQDQPRNLLNWINSLEEIYRAGEGRMKEIDKLKVDIMRTEKGSQEYAELTERLQGLESGLNDFSTTVFNITGWNAQEFMSEMPQILLYGDDLRHQTTLLAKQKYEEGQGRIFKKTQSETQRKLEKNQAERETHANHGIDYSSLAFGEDIVAGPFGIDTDGDGIKDAIDINQDNKPDSIESLTKPSAAPSTVTQFIQGTQWTENLLKKAYSRHQEIELDPEDPLSEMSYKEFRKMALEYDSPSTYGLDVGSYQPLKNEHIANEDYIYNSETNELKDRNTGEVERTLVDAKEQLYWSTIGRSHDGYKVTGTDASPIVTKIKSNKIDKAVENEIDKLESAASPLLATKIPLLSGYQKKGVTEVKVDSNKLLDVLSLADGYYQAGGQSPGSVYEHIKSDVHLSDELVAGRHEMFREAGPIDGAYAQPHWSLSRALGGGHTFHENSVFYEAYYDVLREYWNMTIDQDENTWFKMWHKETAFGDAVGEIPFPLLQSEDWQYPILFKKNYPELWEQIDKKAFEVANAFNEDWLSNTMNGVKTDEKTIELESGYEVTLKSVKFNRQDQYDIMRVLSRIYGIQY